MNMLVDGEWRTDAYQSTNDDGEFERQTATFRDWIRHELEEELRRQWKIKANGIGVSASRAAAAG